MSEKMVIAGAFILCCLLGVSFTVRPNWARRHFPKKTNEKESSIQGKRSFLGHHPDCGTFQNHTIRWKQKTWCSGCFGLFIGLCASILIMILYILLDVSLTPQFSTLLLLLGLSILPVVYLEILYRSRYPIVHVLTNSMLPLSFFLLTITVVGLTGRIADGMFTILLCFLWLDTRIQLSKWRHNSLCSNCTEPCKMYTVTV
jgi:ABC-type nickel/cobalt efflux system permease component RcnA